MKKLWKYLIILFFVVSIYSCISFITGGYSKEVYTAFSTSPGFAFGEKICFLANYRLYRQPLGLRRFPDGGQSKRVYEAVYFMESDGKDINNVNEIRDIMLSDSEIKYTRARNISGKLYLFSSKIGSDEIFRTKCSGNKPETSVISASEESNDGDFSEAVLKISETRKIFLGSFRETELPSPLDYAGKSRKRYIKDVVELKGDFYYRTAVAELLSDSEAAELLSNMEKYEKSLKKKRLEYSIYSEDTRNYIKKRFGL